MKDKQLICPVSTTISLIGGKYKCLILWHLSKKTLRYNELIKLIPSSTPKMLIEQLKQLENDKLIIRKVYPVIPPKVEYMLSDLGYKIKPILDTMYNFGEDYLINQGIKPCCNMEK